MIREGECHSLPQRGASRRLLQYSQQLFQPEAHLHLHEHCPLFRVLINQDYSQLAQNILGIRVTPSWVTLCTYLANAVSRSLTSSNAREAQNDKLSLLDPSYGTTLGKILTHQDYPSRQGEVDTYTTNN